MMKRILLTLSIAIGLYGLTEAQNVGVDVAVPQQKLDVAGGMRIGNTSTGLAGSLRWNSPNFQFHDGTQWITLIANTDDQVFDIIQLSGTDLLLSLEDDGQGTYTIDLSGFMDNTDDQVFDEIQLSGTDLRLSLEDDALATHVIDLSSLVGSDDQTIDLLGLSGTDLQLSLEDDGQATQTVD
ncbi:MAG: hypothetical protein QF371_04975, partial [Flavobacteriales bacterium]|nr:hypothetical protein [Flavobacteriales bacterium]